MSLLDRPTYLYAEVDRLVGLRSGTARRWINGYARSGRVYAPILRVESRVTEWVTWGEFVEARMLAEFRDDSVPTARLRAAVDRLRQEFDLAYPLAHLRPHLAAESSELAIDAKRLNPTDEGKLIIRTGQRLLEAGRPVINNATLASDTAGQKFAAEIEPDFDFPGIKMNPDRLSGQPTFEGRRIAIATVAGMVAAGEAREDVAVDYGLSLANIDAAVRYAAKRKLVA
ncbi:MAG: DUF433 domain-containing protein [Actinomycetia bacterium]|nr:DUF433 domain-containing protein [Actinomycetes bacterium]